MVTGDASKVAGGATIVVVVVKVGDGEGDWFCGGCSMW